MEFRAGDLVRIKGTETQFKLKINATFDGYPLIGDGIIDTFTRDGRKHKDFEAILELIDRPKKTVKMSETVKVEFYNGNFSCSWIGEKSNKTPKGRGTVTFEWEEGE